jgi:RNA polymerase sigma-70 factor, ECF subfamily
MLQNLSVDPTTKLVIQIAAENQIALSQLYDRYSRIIYSIAWKSLNSVEDCEEVVLDVFAQVWKIANRFDAEKGSVEQWIFTIARSRIIDRLRKLQRLNKVNAVVEAEQEIEFPPTSISPLESVEIAERRQQVLTALSQIPAAQRQVITMAYYQGLTHTSIAAATGLSIGTVKTRLRLGLTKLRSTLKSTAN